MIFNTIMCILAELEEGQSAVVEEVHLETRVAHRLFHLGVSPGARIKPMRRGPGGHLRVYHVEGSDVALRRETAKHIVVRRLALVAADSGGD